MSEIEQTKSRPKEETRLVRPGERITLPHALPIPADAVEEMRSLEVEREHHVARRLYEIEASCRGRGGNPWACDY
jgi:hypothetical protein